MGSERTIGLELEKANLIAELDLQRARIAGAWNEVVQPVVVIERNVHSLSRHSWLFGALAAGGGLALVASGGLGIVRKLFKVALFVLPYFMSGKKSGLWGVGLRLLKRLLLKVF